MTALSADRKALLAKIHIAKTQLALDDATYRAVLERVTGCESARDASTPQLIAIIEDFKARGWKDARPKTPYKRGNDGREQASKLRALWLALYNLGEVEVPHDDALAKVVGKITKKQALQWNSVRDLNAGIEGLKSWCVRIGYDPKPYQGQQWSEAMDGRYEPGLIEAQWEALIKLGIFTTGSMARLDTWLKNQRYGVAHQIFLSPEQAQDAVTKLGRWIRKVKAEQKAKVDAPQA